MHVPGYARRLKPDKQKRLYRRAFHDGFRGQPTPSRQTKNIVHVTLGRLVAEAPLPDAVKAALLDACAAETARLGSERLQLRLSAVEFVEETTLGTSSGKLHPIALGAP